MNASGWKLFVPAALLASVLVGLLCRHLFPAPSLESAIEQAVIAEEDLRVRAMVAQYGSDGLRVFRLHGDSEQFRKVLDYPGYTQVVPIITKCFVVGDDTLATMARVQQVLEALRQQLPDTTGMRLLDQSAAYLAAARNLRLPETRALTPEECGAMVLAIIAASENPNHFLGQFTLGSDGVARRLPASSASSMISSLLTSGLRTLEIRLVRGESPSGREWVHAGADTLGMITGVKLLAGHFGHAAAIKSAALVTSTTATAAGILGKFTLKAAIFGGGTYFLIKHPQVVTSLFASVGESLGIGRYGGQVLGITLLCLILLSVLWILLLPIRTLFGFISRLRRQSPAHAR